MRFKEKPNNGPFVGDKRIKKIFCWYPIWIEEIRTTFWWESIVVEQEYVRDVYTEMGTGCRWKRIRLISPEL